MVKFSSIYRLTKGTILNKWRKIEEEVERREKVLDLRC